MRVIISAFVALVLPPFAPAETVWSGVYSAPQAVRGKAVYGVQCGRCHRDDLSGYNGVLIGSRFMNDWREDTLDSFFKIVKQTMPRDAPASLSDEAYLDIVAYVLAANDFPAGDKALTLDTLPAIRVEAKEGAAAVPDFSLVEVVGCLQLGADKSWIVSKATEPVRTRNPNASGPAELDSSRTRPLGIHSFQLLDTGAPPTALRDHKVVAKGFLIRNSKGDRINPSSLQSIGETCPQP